MGSKKIFLIQCLKRAAALASALGVVGGLSIGSASAQTAQYQPLNQQVQPAAFDVPAYQESGVRLPPPTYASIPARNSARIISRQQPFAPRAARQATVNRRGLVGQGRMISAGYRQEPGVPGTLPQKPDRTVLELDDDPQDFFGDKQPMPNTPRKEDPQSPESKSPNANDPQAGDLPPDIFEDPFKNEQRPTPDKRSVEIPNITIPSSPEDPDDEMLPETPESGPNQNPFTPTPKPKPKPNDEIDYQPGRGFGTTRSRSNVYSPPGSAETRQQDNGIYFVPAYDPIPGTQQSTLAPPATIHPHYQQQQAWPGQYAAPGQPQYANPQYANPQYANPQYQQPQYGHSQYQPQYQQPPYGHPQYQPQYQQQPAYPPQDYSPAPAMHPEQQVYTPVVQPPANMAHNHGLRGPMTTARRGLFGKLKQEWKEDWGFGDYQSCQNAGNCGGCDSGCGGGSCGGGATCPVFYFGFQGAWNDAFDVTNSQGSELVLDDGSAFFFSLGRMNGRNLRTEIELSFRDNNISSLLTSDAQIPATGQLQTFSGMANVYWEFVKFPTGRLKPYIGGGVGFLSATADINFADSLTSTSNEADSSSSFAYQWMAGVNFKVSNHLDLYGEYRFVDAESFGIASDRDDLSGDFGYSANSVGGGLRWKF